MESPNNREEAAAKRTITSRIAKTVPSRKVPKSQD